MTGHKKSQSVPTGPYIATIGIVVVVGFVIIASLNRSQRDRTLQRTGVFDLVR